MLVEDGDEFRVGDLILTAVALPGHTTEMLGYALDDVVFTGDTVFRDSVARPDLEAGDDGAEEHARLLSRTLRNELLPLPDDTRLCPGHFTPGTAATDDGTYTLRVGDVESRVGDLATDEEAFVEFVLRDMPPRPANFEEIIAINLGQQDADDEEAFELDEIGLVRVHRIDLGDVLLRPRPQLDRGALLLHQPVGERIRVPQRRHGDQHGRDDEAELDLDGRAVGFHERRMTRYE